MLSPSQQNCSRLTQHGQYCTHSYPSFTWHGSDPAHLKCQKIQRTVHPEIPIQRTVHPEIPVRSASSLRVQHLSASTHNSIMTTNISLCLCGWTQDVHRDTHQQLKLFHISATVTTLQLCNTTCHHHQWFLQLCTAIQCISAAKNRSFHIWILCHVTDFHLTHWGRVTQICVFNTRLFSLHNALNYAIHRACLRMVLLMDVYRNLTSLWINL